MRKTRFVIDSDEKTYEGMGMSMVHKGSCR